MDAKWEPPTVPKSEGYLECAKCGHRWMQMQLSILTEDERQANRLIKEFFKEIIPEINHLTNMYGAWQHHSIPPIEMFQLVGDEQQKMFLKLAGMMIETVGLQATLQLLTEKFLNEMEVGRKDGLIDLPIK